MLLLPVCETFASLACTPRQTIHPMLQRLHLQARGLDALFYKSSAEPAALDGDSSSAAADASSAPPTGAGALPNLPLWRVQWATLPGTQVSEFHSLTMRRDDVAAPIAPDHRVAAACCS